MRKLLFRGFHPNNTGDTIITVNGKKIKGDWVYGSLISCGDRKYICYADDRHSIFDAGALSSSVIPETIGQWVTTDKNGKDVFESDFVKSYLDDEIQGIVEYDTIHCSFVFNTLDGLDTLYLDDDDWIVYGNKCEEEAMKFFEKENEEQ